MKRYNINDPVEISEELAKIPNKSRFIAETLSEKLERMKKEELDRQLIEGYKAVKKEDEKINAEWESATLESW
ncbi:MAG: hypothetical protein M1421_04940 [Candidatus Eremiobacteraeota bacterium]|nr:hypothetical protein [Candidatus Eremiobacteraeota bacterium]